MMMMMICLVWWRWPVMSWWKLLFCVVVIPGDYEWWRTVPDDGGGGGSDVIQWLFAARRTVAWCFATTDTLIPPIRRRWPIDQWRYNYGRYIDVLKYSDDDVRWRNYDEGYHYLYCVPHLRDLTVIDDDDDTFEAFPVAVEPPTCYFVMMMKWFRYWWRLLILLWLHTIILLILMIHLLYCVVFRWYIQWLRRQTDFDLLKHRRYGWRVDVWWWACCRTDTFYTVLTLRRGDCWPRPDYASITTIVVAVIIDVDGCCSTTWYTFHPVAVLTYWYDAKPDGRRTTTCLRTVTADDSWWRHNHTLELFVDDVARAWRIDWREMMMMTWYVQPMHSWWYSQWWWWYDTTTYTFATVKAWWWWPDDADDDLMTDWLGISDDDTDTATIWLLLLFPIFYQAPWLLVFHDYLTWPGIRERYCDLLTCWCGDHLFVALLTDDSLMKNQWRWWWLLTWWCWYRCSVFYTTTRWWWWWRYSPDDDMQLRRWCVISDWRVIHCACYDLRTCDWCHWYRRWCLRPDATW